MRGSVWPKERVFDRLRGLTLAPEQQSSVDIGICFDQWALGRSQLQQPFNDLRRRLIYSLNANHQASTILMANPDFMVDHHLDIDLATATAAQGAFLPVRERDLFSLDPQFTVMGELDSSYQGLLFPDLSLGDPDLESIMKDEVPQEVQTRILAAVKQSQANNQQMVQLWDSKAKSLYFAAAGLVNDRVERLRRFSKLQMALDVCQQSIFRRSGPFVKPHSSSKEKE